MLEGFKRDLRSYCWDIANLKSNEDKLLDEARAISKRDGTSFSQALDELSEHRPELLTPRHLAVEPDDVLISLAEENTIEAHAAAKEAHPQLAELARLYDYDRETFEAACKCTGQLSGEYTATAETVIPLVLEQADKARRFAERDEWPKDPLTGKMMTVDAINEAITADEEATYAS